MVWYMLCMHVGMVTDHVKWHDQNLRGRRFFFFLNVFFPLIYENKPEILCRDQTQVECRSWHTSHCMLNGDPLIINLDVGHGNPVKFPYENVFWIACSLPCKIFIWSLAPVLVDASLFKYMFPLYDFRYIQTYMFYIQTNIYFIFNRPSDSNWVQHIFY